MNDTVHIVQFEAAPMPGNPADGATGAYVNIYVHTSSETEALETAHREIEEAGWQVLNTENISSVNDKNISDAADDREYYDQCLLDGVVLVFHTWRKDNEAH
jgi:hypothetical protein